MARLKSNNKVRFKVPRFLLGAWDECVALYLEGNYKPNFSYKKVDIDKVQQFKNKYPLAIQLN